MPRRVVAEGLYSSQLTTWRGARERGELAGGTAAGDLWHSHRCDSSYIRAEAKLALANLP